MKERREHPWSFLGQCLLNVNNKRHWCKQGIRQETYLRLSCVLCTYTTPCLWLNSHMNTHIYFRHTNIYSYTQHAINNRISWQPTLRKEGEMTTYTSLTFAIEHTATFWRRVAKIYPLFTICIYSLSV